MTVTSIDQDIVRRGIKRELPCKLSDEEFTRIAKQRALKELEVAQLEADLAKEKKKRQDQIDDMADEVAKMGRELATGEQDRTVTCDEVFVKADDGTGWIHMLRRDTDDEVERRPATAHETQRYLPSVGEPGGGLLDQAAHAQRGAKADDANDVPDGSAGDDDSADEETDKPKRKAKKS